MFIKTRIGFYEFFRTLKLLDGISSLAYMGLVFTVSSLSGLKIWKILRLPGMFKVKASGPPGGSPSAHIRRKEVNKEGSRVGSGLVGYLRVGNLKVSQI